MRSDSSSTSSRRCDTKTKPARSLSARTRSNRMAISAFSSTEVGSSSRMTRSRSTRSSSDSALASSIICRVAKLSSDTLVEGSMSWCTFASCMRAAAFIFFQSTMPKRVNSASRPRNRFSATVMLSKQRLLLEHHADALLGRLERMGEMEGHAVAQDVARGVLIGTGEDAHQRRLAGAVLADEADHFAAADGDADVDERLHVAEGLAEVDCLKHGVTSRSGICCVRA